MIPTPAFADEFDILLAAVHEASALVLGYFEGNFAVRSKSGGSPVTEADEAADTLLRTRLMAARPDYGWLSEETVDTQARLSHSRIWVVDPIDGTRAFIKGRPHFTVCGALVEDGQPVLAVVINPATKEIFTARRGAGAERNGKRVRVSSRADLAGARILGPKDMYAHPAWPEPWPDMAIDNPNSVAYRLCLVAAGDRDACLRLNHCHEWDLAAAHLIAAEAGATVTTHTGDPLHYNKPKPTLRSVIAAGPVLYQEIHRRTHMLNLPGQT